MKARSPSLDPTGLSARVGLNLGKHTRFSDGSSRICPLIATGQLSRSVPLSMSSYGADDGRGAGQKGRQSDGPGADNERRAVRTFFTAGMRGGGGDERGGEAARGGGGGGRGGGRGRGGRGGGARALSSGGSGSGMGGGRGEGRGSGEGERMVRSPKDTAPASSVAARGAPQAGEVHAARTSSTTR